MMTMFSTPAAHTEYGTQRTFHASDARHQQALSDIAAARSCGGAIDHQHPDAMMEPSTSDRPIMTAATPHRDRLDEQGASRIRTILTAGAMALGISACVACATTLPDSDVSTDAKPTAGTPTAQRFDSTGAGAPARSPYATPSWSNPTGQVVRGPHGAISLYAPCDCGSG
jgi:hypothetical protein